MTKEVDLEKVESNEIESTDGDKSCSCKKQCILGIASIAIGIGGFLLAWLL